MASMVVEQAQSSRRGEGLARTGPSPLRLRVYALIGLSALVSIVAIGFSARSATEASRQLSRSEFQARTAAIASDIAMRSSEVRAGISSADLSLMQAGSLDAVCASITRDPGSIRAGVTVIDASASVRCSTLTDGGRAVAVQRLIATALADGGDRVGGPAVDGSTGQPALLFAHPIRTWGAVTGVVVASTQLGDLVRTVPGQPRPAHLIVAGRDGVAEVGSSVVPVLPERISQAIERARQTGEPCPFMVEQDTAWSCGVAGAYGIVVAAAEPVSTLFAAVEEAQAGQRWQMAGIVVVAALATVAADFLFMRRIRLAYSNARLAPLPSSEMPRRDEIDVLGTWARTTTDLVQHLQREVDGHERWKRAAERDLLTSIAETVEIRYPFLRNHGDRVGRYARQIGTRLGLSPEAVDLVEFAARIHDLGKIAIADAVYLKPGRLDPIEAAQMQLHAARGGEIASRMRTVPSEVADAIRHHHERWDGTGYPDGLAGQDIPLWSRIIAVADAYDAMTEERPYRDRPHTHGESIRILREGAGSQWDAEAVQAFLEVVERVDLRTGRALDPADRASL